MKRISIKRWMVLLTCTCLSFGITACGNAQTQNDAIVIAESADETGIDESNKTDTAGQADNETKSEADREKKDDFYMGQITAVTEESVTINLVDMKDQKPDMPLGEAPKDGANANQSTDKKMPEPPKDGEKPSNNEKPSNYEKPENAEKPKNMEKNFPLSGEEMILNVSDTTKYYEYEDGKKTEISMKDLAINDMITATMANDIVITITK